jgi:hypothetical protein
MIVEPDQRCCNMTNTYFPISIPPPLPFQDLAASSKQLRGFLCIYQMNKNNFLRIFSVKCSHSSLQQQLSHLEKFLWFGAESEKMNSCWWGDTKNYKISDNSLTETFGCNFSVPLPSRILFGLAGTLKVNKLSRKGSISTYTQTSKLRNSKLSRFTPSVRTKINPWHVQYVSTADGGLVFPSSKEQQ